MVTSLPKLIGLIGRKGSGKDTAAEILLLEGYENVKFAGALKDMLRTLLAFQGMDAETVERMVEGDLKESPTRYLNGKTPRLAMQTLGTEWGRNLIADDLWVASALRKADNYGHVVITDVRFPNEMEAVVKAGGVCIGITADWIVPQEGEHASEALIDELIRSLPLTHRVTNRKGNEGQESFAIADFQARFLRTLTTL